MTSYESQARAPLIPSAVCVCHELWVTKYVYVCHKLCETTSHDDELRVIEYVHLQFLQPCVCVSQTTGHELQFMTHMTYTLTL